MPEQHRVLITAGPTHEPIDAVRYLANRSSGRMGIALAEAAADRGCSTTLLLGPTHLLPRESSHLSVVRFQTAADLQSLLSVHWPEHDVLIMAAAVADFRPAPAGADPAGQTGGNLGKLKRAESGLTLHLEPTPDLLAELAAITRTNQRVIGFALEPAQRLLESARDKLIRKKLDAIVANPLETMDAEHVSATLLLRDGSTLLPPQAVSKQAFAAWLIDWLCSDAGEV